MQSSLAEGGDIVGPGRTRKFALRMTGKNSFQIADHSGVESDNSLVDSRLTKRGRRGTFGTVAQELAALTVSRALAESGRIPRDRSVGPHGRGKSC